MLTSCAAGDSGKPRWQETILADHIKPAAVGAKIQGKVGWYTLRHTYSTLLRAHGTDVKVQQELLRHAEISTTLNVHAQAVSEQVQQQILGHSDPNTTLLYADPDIAERRKAMTQLDGLLLANVAKLQKHLQDLTD